MNGRGSDSSSDSAAAGAVIEDRAEGMHPGDGHQLVVLVVDQLAEQLDGVRATVLAGGLGQCFRGANRVENEGGVAQLCERSL